MGFPVSFLCVSVGFPVFLWDSPWNSVGFPAASVGFPTEILWEWELKFHSHGNPAVRPQIIITWLTKQKISLI